MKLGNFLERSRKGQATPAPTRPVKFRVLSKDSNGERTIVEASAVLAFVDDEERREALIAAEKSLREEFPTGEIPSERLKEEYAYHVLARALRDEEDTAAQFATDVKQLRRALHSMDRVRIYDEYVAFIADEFPEDVDQDTLEKLVEEAEGKSLRALLSDYGYSQIRAALPSLAARYGTSQTGTSGGTGPASEQLDE